MVKVVLHARGTKPPSAYYLWASDHTEAESVGYFNRYYQHMYKSNSKREFLSMALAPQGLTLERDAWCLAWVDTENEFGEVCP